MKRIIFLLLAVIFLYSCRKENPVPDPGKVILISPEKDNVCNTGVPISDLQSNVLFKWNASSNTTSYELIYKDLETGNADTVPATTTEVSVTLFRNRPYSWYILSKSSKTPKVQKSDTWKFYNSGIGIQNYAPFPAEIISPKMGQHIPAGNGKIKLEWTGSDLDQDIVNYDIYFGTGTPALIKAGHSATFLDNISVTPNSTYFWKVITRDSKGNTSSSGIFQFKVI